MKALRRPDYIEVILEHNFTEEQLNENSKILPQTLDEGPLQIYPRKSLSFDLTDFVPPDLLRVICPDNQTDDEDDEFNSVIREDDLLVAQDILDNYGEEEEDEEEDWDDDNQLSECFHMIESKWNVSECNSDQIIFSLRELSYDLDTFFEFLAQGAFGPASPKSSPIPTALDEPVLSHAGKSTKQTSDYALDHPLDQVSDQASDHASDHSSDHADELTPKRHEYKIGRIEYENDRLETIRSEIEGSKGRMNLVVVGHVDAGKSTLVGHLLALKGCVEHSRMAAIERETKRLGKESDKWAWVMAEDAVERERGVTIDVSLADFETDSKIITILDAPGHRDFIPNMIAGASQADSALLVVDATNPLIEKGQAAEHLLLCRSLGLQHLVIAVNKMDAVANSQAIFEDISAKLTKFLQMNIGITPAHVIPLSASSGVNLIENCAQIPWYSGPSLYESLDSLHISQPDLEAPFKMCISEASDVSNRLCVHGRIETGFVFPGDRLSLLTLTDSFKSQIGKVASIKNRSKDLKFAVAGMIVDIELNLRISSENVSAGSALTAVHHSVPSNFSFGSDPNLSSSEKPQADENSNQIVVSTDFVARVMTFGMKTPLLKGSALVFYRHAAEVPLKIVEIKALVDRKTKNVKQNGPTFIPQHSCADIHFRLATPLTLETHDKSKTFGRFVFRAGGETLGFGSISEVLPTHTEITPII